MIIDARNLPANHLLECDVCIVGGGAAGISLALELEDSPRRVCILESGGLSHERNAQALLEGEVLGTAYPDLQETRLAALGGSTALWAGWCRPLEPIDFETRDWVAESGWPFGQEELTPYYCRAHRLCGLGPFDYDTDAWEERTGLKQLPVPDEDFAASMVHVSAVRFGTVYQAALNRSTGIQVLLHAPVLRLLTAANGHRIERVCVRTLEGNRFDVAASTVVLAAGGIENPRLLLLSGDSPERSIGNARGLVGRFFTEHGFINSGSYVASGAHSMAFHFPHVVQWRGHDCKVRSVFSIRPEIMRRERLLNCAIFFHPAYESHAAFDSTEVRAALEIWDKLRGRAVPGRYLKRAAHAIRAPKKLAIALHRRLIVGKRLQQRWRMRALFECLPNRDNCVSLTDERDALGRRRARVDWRLGELDLHSIRRAHQLLDQALRRAGLGHLELRLPDNSSSWESAVEGGKHHMGTTRMHVDPAHGVVDTDCRVHGTSNLYVTGSSVFPTGGFANPTLTIVALAARLATHLKACVHQA